MAAQPMCFTLLEIHRGINNRLMTQSKDHSTALEQLTQSTGMIA